MSKTLKELFLQHKGKLSDKWSLYLDEWDSLFLPFRDQPVRILEIGIQNGGSLEVWGKYFKNAKKIVGCDISAECNQLSFHDRRISVVVGDATSEACKVKILKKAINYDIIIDDGSHKSSDIVRSFAQFFPVLREDGIFVVEDMHCSYWNFFQGGLYNPLSAMSFFKRIADIINYEHWRNNKSSVSLLQRFTSEYGIEFEPMDLAKIHSVEFINSLCIIRKTTVRRNKLGERLVIGNEERVTSGIKKFNHSAIHDVHMDVVNDSDLDVFELIQQCKILSEINNQHGQYKKNLTAQLAEKNQAVRELKEHLTDNEQAAQALSDQLKAKEKEGHSLRNDLAQKEQERRGLQELLEKKQLEALLLTDRQEETKRFYEERLTQVESHLHEIESGLAQRMISSYRRFIEKAFPNGSRRRRFYQLVTRSIVVLFSEGPGGVFRRLRGRGSQAARAVLFTPTSSPSDHLPGHTLLPGEVSDKYAAIYHGQQEVSTGKVGRNYVPLAPGKVAPADPLVKLIAFYLPQFHPIPENDAWWGKGFTEWTNVSKSVPQFLGHQQPRLPGELGFYDLRVPEVQRRQVELARQYGIQGFCFHYYWFAGRRLLERPLEQFASDPQIDFPFCLCWANENWTRRWDGMEDDILMAQEHSPESDHAFIQDAMPFLRHRNYIRINGRPLLIVYRADILPDPEGTARQWKKECRAAGLEEPYLVAAQTFQFTDPRKVGFDAAVEFPPHNSLLEPINHTARILNTSYSGSIYRYTDIMEIYTRADNHPYTVFKTVFPGWDNNPRKPGRGYSFVFSTPENYQRWLTRACQFALKDQDPEKHIVFINAWNEWAEGAYLEPDRENGYAFLQATADSLRKVESTSQPGKSLLNNVLHLDPDVKRHDTAVILHLFYPEMWEEIQAYLENLQGDFDLFVSIPRPVKIDTRKILSSHPYATIYQCENRGRDVAPFLTLFAAIQPLGYDQVCKIHTKRSAHREDGVEWRQDLLNKLLGSPEVIRVVRDEFAKHPGTGLLIPQGHLVSSDYYWGENVAWSDKLAKQAGIDLKGDKFQFGAGSMFWFRPRALYPLTLYTLTLDDFEPEHGQVDGTLAHAFERMFGLVPSSIGFKLLEIDADVTINKSNNQTPKEYAFAHARAHQAAIKQVNRAPIIIFQMGKVGSLTLKNSLLDAYKKTPIDVPIHHVHLLNDLDNLAKAIQTERINPIDTLKAIENGKNLLKQIESNPDSYWKVISLVREPVARNVSAFFENLIEYIPDWEKQRVRGKLSKEYLQKTFLSTGSIHSASEEWFDKQLKPVFGIDIFGSPFPFEKGYKIFYSKPLTPLLVIRLEDLNRCAAEALGEFLGLEGFNIIKANEGDTKAYADIYREFTSYPLPEDYIKRMYATRYARHFYSDLELERFAEKWANVGIDK